MQNHQQVSLPSFRDGTPSLDPNEALYRKATDALWHAASHPSIQNMASAVDAWREWERASSGKVLT